MKTSTFLFISMIKGVVGKCENNDFTVDWQPETKKQQLK